MKLVTKKSQTTIERLRNKWNWKGITDGYDNPLPLHKVIALLRMHRTAHTRRAPNDL